MSSSRDRSVLRPAPWADGSSRGETGEWSVGYPEGYATGYSAGYAAGWSQGAQAAAQRSQLALEVELERSGAERAQARARSAAALDALDVAVARLEARESPVLADMTDAVARVAVELAEAVLGVEVLTGAGARGALARALAAAPQDPVVVRMHPADVVEVSVASSVPRRAQLVPDPALSRGDAVVQHAGGSVDARLAPALQRARAALLALDEDGNL